MIHTMMEMNDKLFYNINKTEKEKQFLYKSERKTYLKNILPPVGTADYLLRLFLSFSISWRDSPICSSRINRTLSS